MKYFGIGKTICAFVLGLALFGVLASPVVLAQKLCHPEVPPGGNWTCHCDADCACVCIQG
jgi:hypothetical protein